MDPRFCVRQFSNNVVAVQSMVKGIDDDQARWKPSPDDWSVVEVINHLVDEERDDFRARIQHLHSGATGPWPPIAPQQWAVERAYNQRDLGESIANYAHERAWGRIKLGQAKPPEYQI